MGPLTAVLLVGVLRAAGRVLAAAGDEADAVPRVFERGAEVIPPAVHALGLAGRQRRRESRLEREIVLASKEQGGVRPPLCRPLVRVAFVVYVNPVAARIRIAGGVANEAGGCNTRVGSEVHGGREEQDVLRPSGQRKAAGDVERDRLRCKAAAVSGGVHLVARIQRRSGRAPHGEGVVRVQRVGVPGVDLAPE